jgi:hypothetical protein
VTSLGFMSNNDSDSLSGNPPSQIASSLESGTGSYNAYIQPMRPPAPDQPPDHSGLHGIGEQFAHRGHRHSSSITSLESSLVMGSGRRTSTGGHSVASTLSLGGSPALPPTRVASPGRNSLRALAIRNSSQTFPPTAIGEGPSTAEAVNTAASSSRHWVFSRLGRTANPSVTAPHSGQPIVHTPLAEESITPDVERSNRMLDVGINTEATSRPHSPYSPPIESQPGPARELPPSAAVELQPRKRDQLKELAKRGLSKVRKAASKLWPSRKHKNQPEVLPSPPANQNLQRHDVTNGVELTGAPPGVENATQPSPPPAQQAASTAAVDEGTSPSPGPSSTTSLPSLPEPGTSSEVMGEGVIPSGPHAHLEEQVRAVATEMMQTARDSGGVLLTLTIIEEGGAARNA